MRHALKLHRESIPSAVRGLEVGAVRLGGGRLEVRFVLTGALGEIALPALTASTRADELWRHTCFEAFVRPDPGEGYFEFNFAPSTQWAAYRFDGYRQGMRPAETPAPKVEVRETPDRFELAATVEGLPAESRWRLGLTAVIEARDGAVSYWALAHPPGRPDFHRADCFALELPAVQGA